jgi:hypothetical protein
VVTRTKKFEVVFTHGVLITFYMLARVDVNDAYLAACNRTGTYSTTNLADRFRQRLENCPR